jgi:uncharacterized protein
MRLLIDTNVFLETMLDQRQAADARAFLAQVTAHNCFITDFALHSICQLLLRRNLAGALTSFLSDTILAENILVLTCGTTDLTEVIETAQLLGLDFDDAYQYAMAVKHDLTLVSFDKDFDKTPRGRHTPQAINQLTAAQNLSDQQ